MSEDNQPEIDSPEWDDAEVWENIEQAGKLIEEGREDEVPRWVLDDYRATQRRMDNQVRHPALEFMKANSPELRQIAAAKLGAQDLAKRASQSIREPGSHFAKHTAMAQQTELPDLDTLTELSAQIQAERVEREEQAIDRAELTDERLADLAYILTQVQRSNEITAKALEAIKEARRKADRDGTRQFWINIVIVVVMGVAAIFGPVILRWLGLD